jgi:[FeFe] hydrogenase (group B1/B3)
MMYDNNATIKRRELLVNIARLAFCNELKEKIEQIPLTRYPKKGDSHRCCIHKARAVVRQRIMAILGLSIEERDDEVTRLSEYAQEALERTALTEPILTVVDEACSACVQTNYFVTNACRGCLARPCMLNCPKKAITMENGQAKINPDLCVDCGICKKVCPYQAIIYMPIPCEEACPVGAITKDERGKERIDYAKCIYCGKCSRACPFGAIMEKSQMVDVISAMKEGKKVIAMIAPAIIGQFPGTLGQLVNGMKRVGFSEVIEVALGADETARNEAHEFCERMDAGAPFMTTSCCPAYTEAVKKHIPELKEKVSETKTPMHYTAAWVKEHFPEAVRVFIGPCIAKRQEALENELIDYVLTFEELGAFFLALDIDVQSVSESELLSPATDAGRRFPLSGGVTESLARAIATTREWKPVLVDGLTKKELAVLKAYARAKAPGNFVEVMSCEGGCVAGPGVICPVKVSKKKVEDFVARSVKKEV